jgi:hypothetical protein
MTTDVHDETPLMPFRPEEMRRFRAAWQDVQTRFVDDPQQAVRGADQLVAEVMRVVLGAFNQHKHELEGRWKRGTNGSETAMDTENLRLALRYYRTFFNQLLHA